MAQDQRKPSDPIGKIGTDLTRRDKVSTETQEPLQRPVRPQPEAETGGVRTPSEGFKRIPENVERATRSIMQHMDASYSTLRLKIPGQNRVVQDKREEAQQTADTRAEGMKETAGKEEAKNFQIRDGKSEEVKQKQYDNFLAARNVLQAKQEAGGQRTDKKERQLSEFEKLVIERFEQGKKIEEMSKDGKTHFMAKTVEQWKSFFDKFTGRTAKKELNLSDIQEFLYRGLVKKDATKGIMISDIIQNSGKTEKFARFGVLYQKMSDFLSQLLPGQTISKADIAQALTSEKLLFLALQPPNVEQELFTGMKARQGIFSSEANEARVARELGIADSRSSSSQQSDMDLRRAGKGKKRGVGGFFGRFVDEEEPMVDQSGRFMPWWSWGKLSRPGGFTLKRAFYSGVIIVFVLVVLFLIDRLLMGK